MAVTLTGPAELLMIFTSDGEVTLLSAPTTSGMLVGTVTLKVEAAAVRVTGVLPVPGDEIVPLLAALYSAIFSSRQDLQIGLLL